jgi:hypothetical protein
LSGGVFSLPFSPLLEFPNQDQIAFFLMFGSDAVDHPMLIRSFGEKWKKDRKKVFFIANMFGLREKSM